MFEKKENCLMLLEKDERRITERVKVNPEVAFAVADNKSVLLGNILDISEVGCSFQFVGSSDLDFNHQDITNIRLVSLYNNLLLPGIPVSIVSNFKNNTRLSKNYLKMRRIGARFEKLSAKQRRQIREFIREISGK